LAATTGTLPDSERPDGDADVDPKLAFWVLLRVAQPAYVLFGFGAGLIAVGAMALFMPQVTDVVALLITTAARLPAHALAAVITAPRLVSAVVERVVRTGC